mmetsp:Transcript_95442/g.189182  ORF Transcript_95442/g.189182 Transcript_95442/m.189182 type:complete len:109 (+) Transcript_95442:185-511(+)
MENWKSKLPLRCLENGRWMSSELLCKPNNYSSAHVLEAFGPLLSEVAGTSTSALIGKSARCHRGLGSSEEERTAELCRLPTPFSIATAATTTPDESGSSFSTLSRLCC